MSDFVFGNTLSLDQTTMADVMTININSCAAMRNGRTLVDNVKTINIVAGAMLKSFTFISQSDDVLRRDEGITKAGNIMDIMGVLRASH